MATIGENIASLREVATGGLARPIILLILNDMISEYAKSDALVDILKTRCSNGAPSNYYSLCFEMNDSLNNLMWQFVEYVIANYEGGGS